MVDGSDHRGPSMTVIGTGWTKERYKGSSDLLRAVLSTSEEQIVVF